MVHVILDVKMGENLHRKYRFAADGNKTETSISITYKTVLSQDSFIICLTIAAINDIHVLASNVDNGYLSVTCCEQVWMRTIPESGNCEGKVLIIRNALYGLMSSGVAFWIF